MNDNKIYTVEGVAKELQTNTQTVYRLLQSGELQGHKRLRKWYVLHKHIIAYLEKAENAHG